jgi:hypothetical protein
LAVLARLPHRAYNYKTEIDQLAAEHDAAAIYDYWISRGYLGIRVEIIHTQATNKHAPSWGVRSNIGPTGYPPRF